MIPTMAGRERSAQPTGARGHHGTEPLLGWQSERYLGAARWSCHDDEHGCMHVSFGRVAPGARMHFLPMEHPAATVIGDNRKSPQSATPGFSIAYASNIMSIRNLTRESSEGDIDIPPLLQHIAQRRGKSTM
jgi:hypothetical protein